VIAEMIKNLTMRKFKMGSSGDRWCSASLAGLTSLAEADRLSGVESSSGADRLSRSGGWTRLSLKYRYQAILSSLIVLLMLPVIALQARQSDFTPSDERSSFEERRKSILDANTLRATYHNFGFAGRASEVDELYFEFPKNTNRSYLYFASVFTGAEVTNQQDGSSLPIVVAPNYRTDPQTGSSWAKNPVIGYYNDNSPELARSDQGPNSPFQNTWPTIWPDKLEDLTDPGWPGQWNGFFGKDIFNADQEFFYRTGDDLYTRYSRDGRYLPDSSDPNRGGLGLIMDSRVLSWTQNLISNVHFSIFEIRNDSENDYDKVSFMLWTADWLGTPSYDYPFFDQQRSIAFYTDVRPTESPPEFDGQKVGVTAIRFLETPGNAIDGIDNDGDSDFYFAGGPEGLYRPSNQDLYQYLTDADGGFFPSKSFLNDQIVPQFLANDFQEYTIGPGDPLVLIHPQTSERVLMRYPQEEVFEQEDPVIVTLGEAEFVLPSTGLTVREDTLNARHRNLQDDDFDGLIDENQPNHLTLSRFVEGSLLVRAVRYINYTWSGYFDGYNEYPGIGEWTETENGWVPDQLIMQPGLVIPDEWIQQRIESDAQFEGQITAYQESLRESYSRQPVNPVFPESYFDRFYRNHATSAPMIDESREDFFDNTRAWLASDDVGLDGVEGTGSIGELDGFPTSGAFTPFPGEPGIDKTDVQEPDAIGITSATIVAAGALNLSGIDSQIWLRYMQPGDFDNLTVNEAETGDWDQFLTSGFFPLKSGSVERFAIAITAAQSNIGSGRGLGVNDGLGANREDATLATNQLNNAFQAYDANYQFAIAPPPPNLTAVPGDGRVTLYWDGTAEDVYDRFLDRIGANPRNFEGYRVYRTTDPALSDARTITDGRGSFQFLEPIAQFDVKNGISGNHPIPISGTEFYLGDDSGLRRSFVDTDIINGRQYYYIVTAYNSGAVLANIAPSESPISLSIAPDGTLQAGQNVKRVTPTGTSAGFVGPAELELTKVSGEGTGSVFASVIDPFKLEKGVYEIRFQTEEDDAQSTASFDVINTTTGEVLIEQSTDLLGEEVFVNGVELRVLNDVQNGMSNNAQPTADILPDLHITPISSMGGRSIPATFVAQRMVENKASTDHSERNQLGEYLLIYDRSPMALYRTMAMKCPIVEEQVDENLSPVELPIVVRDLRTGKQVDIAYQRNKLLRESYKELSGPFSAIYLPEEQRTYSDILFLLDDSGDPIWRIHMEPHPHNEPVSLQPGDQLSMVLSSEFTDQDVYRFTIDDSHIPREDLAVAAENLDQIRVVPNPYIVTNITEPRPTEARPTQLRQLHFINLPAQCTIRIFTLSGRLVQTLQVNNPIDNDRYVWDMLTKDNLEMSYGVYIYHVSAPGIGEATGRFAIIK